MGLDYVLIIVYRREGDERDLLDFVLIIVCGRKGDERDLINRLV